MGSEMCIRDRALIRATATGPAPLHWSFATQRPARNGPPKSPKERFPMSIAQASRTQKRKPAVLPAPRRHAQAEADYLRGLAFTRKELWAQAADAFASAVARNPDDAVFWLNLAHARVKLGELDKAADAARQAAELDPDSEVAVSIASQCLAAGNRHEETIAMLQLSLIHI